MESHPAAASYAALLERCSDVLLRMWFPWALPDPPVASGEALRHALTAANSASHAPSARVYRLY